MLCQNCQKRIANVHFTQIINNNKIEMYLCEQCAKEKGQPNFERAFSMNDLLSGLIGLGMDAPYIAPSAHQSPQVVCSKCGMSYEEFQKNGKLGCGNCYVTFRKKLEPIIRRIHGTLQHQGKSPGKVSENIKTTNEIEMLKEQLGRAVKNEEYEKAAELRDKIRELESKLMGG